MCGRFTLTVTSLEMFAQTQQLAAQIFDPVRYRPRYNIAPTNEHVIVRIEAEDFAAQNAKWGLINSWAKDAKRAGRQINAPITSRSSAGKPYREPNSTCTADSNMPSRKAA